MIIKAGDIRHGIGSRSAISKVGALLHTECATLTYITIVLTNKALTLLSQPTNDYLPYHSIVTVHSPKGLTREPRREKALVDTVCRLIVETN